MKISIMKKYTKISVLLILIFLVIPLLVLGILGLTVLSEPEGKTNKAKIISGISSDFTETDYEQAVILITQKFKDFKGCSLLKLWYDEEYTNTETLYRKKTTMVFLSDFKTSRIWHGDGFNTNQTYTDWQWVLVKNDETYEWRIADYGYC